jgi:putative membrane protein insertion efficiency factor
MLKKLAVSAINFYRNFLSFSKLPCCRFYPSCSAYAAEAIEKKGLFKGLLLSSFRIIRCNPFSRGGYDPVKE